MKAISLIIAFLSLGLTLFSCAARIDGTVAANGSAVLNINMSLERQMTSLIQRVSAAGGQSDGQVIDGASIAISMMNAPGIASTTLRNTSRSAVAGEIRISKIDEFLSTAGGSGFITFEQRTAGGRILININHDNGPEILELLSPEISDYLNALMSPIATGEKISKAEYIDIVTSFYSKAISDEIAASRIRASIDFPGNISSLRGGTSSGRRANFDIPLLDLLVLETPLSYEVVWN